ncbi:MAG: heat-inducible transcriptional repressor HrcA [Rhodobacteraceae bacterium]|nr:heat-inducible transcriptional repressor HrcA [Paracoccaceae bacterium]
MIDRTCPDTYIFVGGSARGVRCVSQAASSLSEMSARSREVFRRLVETYLETGEPVGSRTLSRAVSEKVSAATIRNVMQDLEYLGLLDSPHISAGRIPTQLGLRLFVDGILEIGDVAGSERAEIERSLSRADGDLPDMLDRAGDMLSGLTHGASLVLAPKTEAPIRHIEFVALAPDRGLVVLVTADGHVENRLFTPPAGLTPSAMQSAANFLNAILQGRTLSEMRSVVAEEIEKRRAELDALSRQMIESGLATWSDEPGDGGRLIVRGRSNLLEATGDAADLERIRELFNDLERKRDLAQLLELSEIGDGVRVFIGSENKLFSLSGSSLVVSPYMNADRKIIGAVGVIGPTRLNYGRIVPIVDYTAQLVGRLVSSRSQV